MVMEFTLQPMAVNMKGNFTTIKSLVKEFILGQTEISILVSGEAIRSLAKDSLYPKISKVFTVISDRNIISKKISVNWYL